jgi:hypothetical protein
VRPLAALLVAFWHAPIAADDIGAAARGVVRLMVVAQDYADPENSSLGFGSGFAVSPHRIVTNAHVVAAAQNPYAESLVAVVPSEGTKPLRGTVVAYDPAKDLAIIDVGYARLEPLAIYSGPVDAGEHAAALGYPGNVDRATINSFDDLIRPTAPVRAEGNISSQRSVDGTPAYLHTAPISRGNSGGPLVDECGRVLGVNTYTTVTDSGDAPFGFAIVSQQLMTFLQENGEKYQQIGSPCVSMREQAARDQSTREAADKEQALAERRAAERRQHQLDSARLAAQDSRENHVAAALLLGALALIGGGASALLFANNQMKPASGSAAGAAFCLIASAYAFFSRPSLNVQPQELTTVAKVETAAVGGKLLCQVKPEESRVTVSSTDDLSMTWDATGCMNGRTQYVEDNGTWRRVLVPNGSETVYVQEFDPMRAEFTSIRYLLSQSDMEHLRSLRSANASNGCQAAPAFAESIREINNSLMAALPRDSNEKILYRCSKH